MKQHPDIKVFIGDQSDTNFLKTVRDQLGTIDLIVDDGGHRMEQQITSFKELYSLVKPNGIYCIEDLATSYLSSYGGGFKNSHSAIEFIKELIDGLQARVAHQTETENLPARQWADYISTMQIGEEIVCFTKTK